MPVDGDADKIRIINHGGCLEITASAPASVERPTLIPNKSTAYAPKGTPLLYPGMTVTIDAETDHADAVSVMFKVRHACDTESEEEVSCSLFPNTNGRFVCTPPCAKDDVITAIGFAFSGATVLKVRSIQFGGKADLLFDPVCHDAGWLFNLQSFWGPSIGKNEGRGVLVTGNRYWTDVRMECDIAIHAADRCGIILRYQGLERSYLLVFENGQANLIRRDYGREILLASAPFQTMLDQMFHVDFTAKGSRLIAEVDGKRLEADDPRFTNGACGFYVEMGVMKLGKVHICADTDFTKVV